MTTFFLHGSVPRPNSTLWEELVRTCLLDNIFEIRALIVNFASYDPATINSKNQHVFDGTAEEIYARLDSVGDVHKNMDDYVGHTDMALLDPDVFLSQLHWANLLYVTGGNGDWLQEHIRRIIDIDTFTNILTNGISCYVGNSAGSNLLSDMYYSNDNAKIDKGLGILKVATFCHYHSSKFVKLTALAKEAAKNGCLLIPIVEGQYVSFRI